ncbi:aldo/keto reductase [Halorussus sp. MSC15.2]|uniref:aldo/keto reductase n=1 Tax=Halorussus sp. MSC15.2 TaxID=2283638 RepID=UPI0013D04DFC|nr:aldo/keto reductase [Halorussus sp. MSC15.2]NEU57250.1 aldo/keto reductase [Halorussus sp. MSC15.2]
MEYTTLGDIGLSVSRICLGCLGFGDGKEWMLDSDESREIIDRAIDLGVNFFDTANVYSKGGSEEILGEAIDGYDRDRLVVATKVFGEMDESNPNARGLSRKAIEQELSNSLDRLGVDTIDLYQTHRWDDEVPVEETLRTLDDAVRRGSVRYVGASTTLAYQLAEARRRSEALGLQSFVSMQNHYNLLYREEEREMLPYCRENGVGVLPWSPLAKGYLARPHAELETTARGRTNDYTDLYPYLEGNGREINERVAELADENGVTMAQIALAWLFHKDVVDAPVVGTTSIEHLEQAVEALDISLSDSDMEYLEEPYEPVRHTL